MAFNFETFGTGDTAPDYQEPAVEGGFDFETFGTGESAPSSTDAVFDYEKPKPPLGQRIANITGGGMIAQGLGQSLANKGISKQINDTLNESFAIQGQLLQSIKRKKQMGENTQKLEVALRNLNEDIISRSGGVEELLNQGKLTKKQVLGDAIQLGTTIAAFGTYGSASKVPTAVSKVTNVGKGIVQGVAKGALRGAGTGALVGASGGISTGLKGYDESRAYQESIGEKPISLGGYLLGEGANQAARGAVLGGVLGGVVGGISGGVNAAKYNKASKHIQAVTPRTKDLTPTEYEDLLRQRRITPKTATTPPQYIHSKGELATAEKYKDLLQSGDPVKNNNNILNEITKQDDEVGKFLDKNNRSFNGGELKNFLTKKMDKIDDLTIDETRLTKAKKALIDTFTRGVEKKNMKNLWITRKAFDRQIESAFRGSPSLQKEVKLALRNGVQDFIAERTPEGVYKGYMKDMSNLFRLQENVSGIATKEKGINMLQAWIRQNPTKSKVLLWAIPSIGLGAFGSKLLNTVSAVGGGE